MITYGIIGNPLSHSHSPDYFSEKFKLLNLKDHQYLKFELQEIEELPKIIKSRPDLAGFNVTSPFKERVIAYLDELDMYARFIGAVNTVKITRQEGKKHLTGYNTDAYGFEHALRPKLREKHKRALILGTGGASKAVKFVFKKLGISYQNVTRRPLKSHHIVYWAVTKQILEDNLIIVNTTPLGMHPGTMDYPSLPYEYITPDHLMFDLIYNPAKTRFLEFSKKAGATTVSGVEMFRLQAERAWEIWRG
ncbi:MAG: shikimate dehydrogenase [Bacteroidales bacterium]|nr:shikimate dehydrogenase [Bacteroidales bacterium]MCF8343088.1 shikimate dehydrogenase [Bacteroidales bacterium]MCF8375350.1 shikimate dehydrogenase [Bacteroidales bacterium]MCF8400206.1 shikimate dehydrogenase [Bacteroidales bacterium]